MSDATRGTAVKDLPFGACPRCPPGRPPCGDLPSSAPFQGPGARGFTCRPCYLSSNGRIALNPHVDHSRVDLAGLRREDSRASWGSRVCGPLSARAAMKAVLRFRPCRAMWVANPQRARSVRDGTYSRCERAAREESPHSRIVG